ncbi:hypothetical protein EON83_27780 [bacterium]|nr:MAG: hypothetical protein EON83_27780 [bacterium]
MNNDTNNFTPNTPKNEGDLSNAVIIGNNESGATYDVEGVIAGNPPRSESCDKSEIPQEFTA